MSADGTLNVFFKRPALDSTLKNRLAHLSGLHESNIEIGANQKSYELNNFLIVQSLINILITTLYGTNSKSSPSPSDAMYRSLIEAKNYVERICPRTKAIELHRAALLIAVFTRHYAPLDIMGIMNPDLITNITLRLSRECFLLGLDPTQNGKATKAELITQYSHYPEHMTPSILVRGLSELIDTHLNIALHEFSSTFRNLYRLYILGFHTETNWKLASNASDDDRAFFFRTFVISEALQGLRLLMPKQFNSLVPSRYVACNLDTVHQWPTLGLS